VDCSVLLACVVFVVTADDLSISCKFTISIIITLLLYPTRIEGEKNALLLPGVRDKLEKEAETDIGGGREMPFSRESSPSVMIFGGKEGASSHAGDGRGFSKDITGG
jgi:hypothetical protein